MPYPPLSRRFSRNFALTIGMILLVHWRRFAGTQPKPWVAQAYMGGGIMGGHAKIAKGREADSLLLQKTPGEILQGLQAGLS